MLVEINLLPQKEPRKFAFFGTLAGILVILLLAGSYYYFQISSVKSDIASVNREITMTKKIREAEEKKNTTAESSTSVNQLKSAIEWAHTYPIRTIPVMRKLTSLLPERGFIQSFAYTEAGTITLTVQFDSQREAAFFLNNIHESNWIEDASLSSLTAVVQSDTAASGTQVASTQSGTVSSVNPNSQVTVAGSNTEGQAAATTGAATTTAAVQTTTAGGSAATSTTAASTQDSNLLPRYTAQFEITLNKDAVKENIKKSWDEKGVSGS
ncbi:PilN domain-containing protein [Neobacillus citreus]|uniref:PilN domain-containing protein n=1 Tax=Neobacillus citreus TaxID=2833578 RepID=A0A942YCK1_9BACI|nr:PilN domain-containing protein [Neobacillus citreus]MCH6266694.1 PilN domain-containing protein [Neobacillus citreus]